MVERILTPKSYHYSDLSWLLMPVNAKFSSVIVWLVTLFTLTIPAHSFGKRNFTLDIEKEISLNPTNLFSDKSSKTTALTQHKYRYTIQSGDTLANIFYNHKVPYTKALPIIEQLEQVFDTKRITAGQNITISYAPDSKDISEFTIENSPLQKIVIRKEHDNSYTPQIIEDETVTKFMRAKGTIQSSVYLAAKSSALPEKLILDFIRIYSHSIDFQRDIKQGDQFEVLYERQFTIDGKDTNKMSIVFASLTTNRKQREVYRYHDEVTDRYEYYDVTGHSIKRGLLRTPINGARLSSGFGMRKHPILGYSKMHKGVDFAAPRGTPIFAAGDGTVTAAKTYGSYGRYIKIRHYNSYSTAYAHLHRFARNIKKGKRVKQGQVIGYVGSTGRSTGNHLHYEVHRNGKHINPKKIVLPARSQLKGVELARFQAYSNSVQELVSNIPTITNTNVASLHPRSQSSVH